MGQAQKSKQVTEITSALSNVFIWVGTDCFIQGTHCRAVNEEKSYSLISASFCWNLDSWGRCLLQTKRMIKWKLKKNVSRLVHSRTIAFSDKDTNSLFIHTKELLDVFWLKKRDDSISAETLLDVQALNKSLLLLDIKASNGAALCYRLSFNVFTD